MANIEVEQPSRVQGADPENRSWQIFQDILCEPIFLDGASIHVASAGGSWTVGTTKAQVKAEVIDAGGGGHTAWMSPFLRRRRRRCHEPFRVPTPFFL